MSESSAGHARLPRSAGGDVDIAAIGALVADPARCRILLALADGRALPASRLAADVGISPGTASSHLGKLTEAGLLLVEARGRYRYYRLAGPEVGDLIEALERFAPAVPVRSLSQSRRARALREARMCYDHLAGRLGVELMRVLIEDGTIASANGPHDATKRWEGAVALARVGATIEFDLTKRGAASLLAFGVRVATQSAPIRYHMDSTEQRLHVAGPLGRGLLDRFIALEWVQRTGDSRALLITRAGRYGLDEQFKIRLDA